MTTGARCWECVTEWYLCSTVSSSTAEAVLITTERAAQEALYLKHLLCNLGYEQMHPTVIYEDNQVCISMSKHSSQSKRCWHCDNLLYDLVKKTQEELRYLKTSKIYIASDMFTKEIPLRYIVYQRNTLP